MGERHTFRKKSGLRGQEWEYPRWPGNGQNGLGQKSKDVRWEHHWSEKGLEEGTFEPDLKECIGVLQGVREGRAVWRAAWMEIWKRGVSFSNTRLKVHQLLVFPFLVFTQLFGVYSNSCLLSWWCHPSISSFLIPFSSHLQSFPASVSFPMSQFFKSGGQSVGISAKVTQWISYKARHTDIRYCGWETLLMSHCPLKSPSTVLQNIFQTHYPERRPVIVCLPASSQASLCSRSGCLSVAPPGLCI